MADFLALPIQLNYHSWKAMGDMLLTTRYIFSHFDGPLVELRYRHCGAMFMCECPITAWQMLPVKCPQLWGHKKPAAFSDTGLCFPSVSLILVWECEVWWNGSLGIAVGLRVGKDLCSVVAANTSGRNYTQRWIGEMAKTCLNRHINKIPSSARSTEWHLHMWKDAHSALLVSYFKDNHVVLRKLAGSQQQRTDFPVIPRHLLSVTAKYQ